MADPVVCSCGWRGRRVWAPCECSYEAGVCACGPRVGYGRCARCGRRGLETPTERRARLANDAATAAWMASPEGIAALNSVEVSRG